MLDTDRDTDKVLGDTRRELFFVRELLVGGGSGLDDEGLGVTDVGQVRGDLDAVDEGVAGFEAALDAKGEDGTESVEVLFGELVAGVVGETGVADPSDFGALLEPLSELESVLAVARGAEGEGLETLKLEPSVEGAVADTEITEDFDTETDGKGPVGLEGARGREDLPEVEAVVASAGLGEERELAVAPVEFARVDDDATNDGAVAANPLGSRVEDNVSAVLDGADNVTTVAKGVVDDQRNAGGVGNVGDGAVVGNVVGGVAEGLDVNTLGLVVDGGLDVLGLVAVDKLDLDAETREGDLEQVVLMPNERNREQNVKIKPKTDKMEQKLKPTVPP